MRSLLRPFVPPIVVSALRRLKTPAVSFSGDFPTWEAASAQAGGYDAQLIIERVAEATRRVNSGAAVYERDSVLFDRIYYSWPLLTCLLQVAAEAGSLRVIDFGGSLGSTWRQNRKFLSRLPQQVAWRVVEQQHFVALGQREFTEAQLTFHGTLADAARPGADVTLFSSSLCYLPDPWAVLQEAQASGTRYLIIDRLPVIPGERDRIALQTVREPIYPASYPVRLFAEAPFLARLNPGWRLIERWEAELQPDPDSTCYGFFLEKR